MKTIVYIIIGVILFSCTSKKENFGKLLIIEDQFFYESEDIYFPHDYFVEVDMQRWNGWLDTVLFLEKTKEMKSDKLIRALKNCKPLLSNWEPAIFKDKPVKSNVNLLINIKD